MRSFGLIFFLLGLLALTATALPQYNTGDSSDSQSAPQTASEDSYDDPNSQSAPQTAAEDSYDGANAGANSGNYEEDTVEEAIQVSAPQEVYDSDNDDYEYEYDVAAPAEIIEDDTFPTCADDFFANQVNIGLFFTTLKYTNVLISVFSPQ